MQDYLFVSFFLGHDAGDAARLLLNDCDLLEHALSTRSNRHAWSGDLHTRVNVRLPSDDERLQRLLRRLHDCGVKPFTRADRDYSLNDLDAAEWLMFRVATAGLYGGVDYAQEYDFAAACPTCGAGAVPIPPLIAELGSMGKKEVDHLVYEGHIILSERVAQGIAGTTGMEAAPVRSPRRRPDSRFAWLRITETLPKMHSSTIGYDLEDLCRSCGRAGHYGSPMEPETPRYDRLPASVADFNLTWEYFGNWQQRRNESHTRSIGGSRGIVVSQRVRQILLRLKVQRLVWIPVEIVKKEQVVIGPPN